MSLYKDGSSLTCDATDDNYFMMHVFEYLKLISYCVIPFIIVIVLNTCIIVRLRRTAPLQRADSVSVASSATVEWLRRLQQCGLVGHTDTKTDVFVEPDPSVFLRQEIDVVGTIGAAQCCRRRRNDCHVELSAVGGQTEVAESPRGDIGGLDPHGSY